jgi:hypothetical protein
MGVDVEVQSILLRMLLRHQAWQQPAGGGIPKNRTPINSSRSVGADQITRDVAEKGPMLSISNPFSA